MLNQQVLDIKSWGKQFLICFNGFSLRVHFQLFKTYRINERKDSMPRLRLNFDQDIFAGVVNVIKNEVLFRIKVHPASLIAALPQNKIISMIEEVRTYSFEFLEWKKEYTLKAHWLAHMKKTSPRCHIPFHKEYLGKTNRRSYFCTNCQELYLIENLFVREISLSRPIFLDFNLVPCWAFRLFRLMDDHKIS